MPRRIPFPIPPNYISYKDGEKVFFNREHELNDGRVGVCVMSGCMVAFEWLLNKGNINFLSQL